MNTLMDKFSNKPGTPSNIPSKTVINSWLKSLFPDLPLSTKIEDFGDGVIYCRLLSHFYGNPHHSKITWAPKNEYEYANNLKHVQNALLQLNIGISFDVGRVAKRRFLENWALINAFYRHLSAQEPQKPATQEVCKAPSAPRGLKRASSSTPTFEQCLPPKYPVSHPHQQPLQTPLAPLCPNLWQNSYVRAPQPSLMKQNLPLYTDKGKWSVGAQMFQNNHNAVVDRVKQILLKPSHDTEKIRQIKMLLGLPIDEEDEIIKIQDDDFSGPIVHSFVQPTPSIDFQIGKNQGEKELAQIKEVCQQVKTHEHREAKASVSKTPKKPFKI